MKLVPILAILNSALAVVCALLASAPFTPAPMLFFILLPLAALFAKLGQRISPLVVVVAAFASVLLSPIPVAQLPSKFQLIAGGWLLLWSAVVIYQSMQRRGANMAGQSGGASGA